jgi:hypothetical protein
MIDLNDENDPMLFAVNVPAGRLVVQYMEVLATVQAGMTPGSDPTTAQVATGIREASRTPDVAAASSDAILMAAWHRMTTAVQKQGNA